MSGEVGHADDWLDHALAHKESYLVHLLVSLGAKNLDIRRAYSAVDRYSNPQPFRLMETFRLPPIAHLALAYLPAHGNSWKKTILRRYLENFPRLPQAEIHGGLQRAADILAGDSGSTSHGGLFGMPFRAEELPPDVDSIVAGLHAIADTYNRPWSVGSHQLFPESFRIAVECCILFWPATRPHLHLHMALRGRTCNPHLHCLLLFGM